MKLIDDVKKSSLIVLIIAVGGALIFADKTISAGRNVWQTIHEFVTPQPKDRFTLSGVKMAFVVTALSEEKIRIVGETIVPIFENLNDYPVTIQFNRISVSINGQEAPAVPLDDMTITFRAHNGPAGWYGKDPRVPATNGTVLNGTIDANLTYFNVDNGLRKEMRIRGRVVARLPKRGRVVAIEWSPDTDSARASAQASYKHVILGPPDMPLSPEDQAVISGQTAER